MNQSKKTTTVWIGNRYESLYISDIKPIMETPLLSQPIKQVKLAVPIDLQKYKAFCYYDHASPAIEETPYNNLVGILFGEFLVKANKHTILDLYEYSFELSSGVTVGSILGGDLYIQNARKHTLEEILAGFGAKATNLSLMKFGCFYELKNGAIQKTTHSAEDGIGFVCANPELIINME